MKETNRQFKYAKNQNISNEKKKAKNIKHETNKQEDEDREREQ